ncbi:uncharacterized protein A4U43_C04F1530 [Asparagus officinalis]|uniref:Uncharacterized protein n=1 Tax=Asparagus officinalis TaxID=4686 RepID=A0A5P1F058_ASPOF|nr:uncharacterized protein A4U43_C04F1530 [Asparagus officinalis]
MHFPAFSSYSLYTQSWSSVDWKKKKPFFFSIFYAAVSVLSSSSFRECLVFTGVAHRSLSMASGIFNHHHDYNCIRKRQRHHHYRVFSKQANEHKEEFASNRENITLSRKRRSL